MIIELPCGVCHNEKIYDRVNIKEITGKQQNYLVDMDLVVESIGHVPKLLEDLTCDYMTADGLPLELPVKDAIWKLAVEDIEFILIKMREATYGPAFAMPVTCPHCSTTQTKKIDLDTIEAAMLKDKNKRTMDVELPKSKITAVVKLMYLKDLFDLYAMMREEKSTLYTSTMKLSVAKLGDKEDVTKEDLENLPITDLQKIEEAWKALRGSVDTIINHDCDSCKQEFDTPLPMTDPSFFAQSQIPSM